MPGRWLTNAGDFSRRMSSAAEAGWHSLAQPERARRLRQGLMVLLLLWLILALVKLVWALVPGATAKLPTDLNIINPISSDSAAGQGRSVDIDALVARHLFGKASAGAPVKPVPEQQAAANDREGIEKGARETRLDIRLVGIVASTESGLGHAIIEYRKKQDVYAVEDKLPVSGQVVLAKVMPQQIVLDNGGTYELLKLFDKSSLSSQVPAAKPRSAIKPAKRGAALSTPAPAQASAVARDYRDRLYQNPQSLAEVVRVSAVRESGKLLGYRISPGVEKEQFQQLGLKTGDMVTSVNGVALDDPANTVRLYQAMRTASEAVFELQRDGQPVTVTVSLADQAGG